MPVYGFGAVPLKPIEGWPFSVKCGNNLPLNQSPIMEKSPDNSGPLVSKIMNFESMLESKAKKEP